MSAAVCRADPAKDAWYLLHTRPRQEFRACRQLENQGYACFLPTCEIAVSAHAKRRQAPLFSRYLLIRLNAVRGNWDPIRSTRGVDNLVRFGERFATLPDECVEALRCARRLAPRFRSGETVTIVDGPFAGLEGIYQEPDGEVRALILIELMHQPQKLSFAVASLRRSDA